MPNKIEQLLNRIQPVRRDLLKGLLVTGALANIALPASTVLIPTEASAQEVKAPSGPTTSAPAAGGGSCTPSLVRTCNSKDPTAFDVCDNGTIVTRKCAPGTTCDKGFCVAARAPTAGGGGFGLPAGGPPAGGGPSGGVSPPAGPADAKQP